jgi:hypothetical protein
MINVQKLKNSNYNDDWLIVLQVLSDLMIME